jgi:hypothetical protein
VWWTLVVRGSEVVAARYIFEHYRASRAGVCLGESRLADL